MRKTILSAMLISALAAPALADSYPVTGAWGPSTSSDKGAIDCAGKRVITFNGNQRQDSNGGVPAYRNKSVTPAGPSSYRIQQRLALRARRSTHALRVRLLDTKAKSGERIRSHVDQQDLDRR